MASKEKIDYWSLISESSRQELLKTPRNIFRKTELLDLNDLGDISIDKLILDLQEIKKNNKDKFDSIVIDHIDGYEYVETKIVGNTIETTEQFLNRIKNYAQTYYNRDQRKIKNKESEKALYERLKKKFEKQ